MKRHYEAGYVEMAQFLETYFPIPGGWGNQLISKTPALILKYYPAVKELRNDPANCKRA